MSATLRLCPVADVQEGLPVRVELEGRPAFAIFQVKNEHVVTLDKCTHGAGRLSEGTQDGSLIECPMHGGMFDLHTGQAVQFPCRVALTRWQPSIEDGWICIPSSDGP